MFCILEGPEHVFKYVNEAHIKVLGFDATGKAVREAQPESVEVHGILDNVYQTGETAELHEIPVTVGWGVRYFNLTYAAKRDKAGTIDGILILGIEVTDQVVTRKKLEQAVQVRDEFISIASHELKTPVTSLKMQLQITQRHLETNTVLSQERLKKSMFVSLKQVDRLTRLIEDMLDMSKIQAGKMMMVHRDVNLTALISEIIERHQDSFQHANCLVEFHYKEIEEVQCDAARIDQVITNLLLNATKYGAGKPISISIDADAEHGIIAIKDNGIGIHEDFRHKIFDRFERAAPDSNISGWGIGLYIAKQIVDAHKGSIQVNSQLNAGSEFIVRIPLKQISR